MKMNELLQKHGCANVFSIPEGLKELMADISREVLRDQPAELYKFIANYLSCLLITREHGIMSVKILDDLCDCRPTIAERLTQLGLGDKMVAMLTDVIQEAIEGTEAKPGTEAVRETEIIREVLKRSNLDELMGSRICQIIRNAYRDYWYRKNLLKKNIRMDPEEPWEIAAQHTLEIYKKTRPSFQEITRAASRIQAAYRGYHVRSCLLQHLRIQRKYKDGPKVRLPGPPLDVADSREVHLGPITDITVKKDDVRKLFEEHATRKLGIKYDPNMTITLAEPESEEPEIPKREHRAISFSEPVHDDSTVQLLSEEKEKKKVVSTVEMHEAEKEEKAEEVQEVIAPPPAEETAPEVPEEITDKTVTSHGEETLMEADEIPEELTTTGMTGTRTEADAESYHTNMDTDTTGEADEMDDDAQIAQPDDAHEEHKE